MLLGWQTCASRVAASHCRAAARALPAARGSRSRQAGAPRADHARTARREANAECHGGTSRQGDSSGTATRAAIRGAAPCIFGEATSRFTRSFALVQFGRGLHPRLQMLTSEIEMRSRGHQIYFNPYFEGNHIGPRVDIRHREFYRRKPRYLSGTLFLFVFLGNFGCL